jgi:hypothetical protein
MLYTIIGAISGGLVTFLICRICNIKTDEHHGFIRMPSGGQICILAGTILGAGMGFGYGVSSLANGTHLINKIL